MWRRATLLVADCLNVHLQESRKEGAIVYFALFLLLLYCCLCCSTAWRELCSVMRTTARLANCMPCCNKLSCKQYTAATAAAACFFGQF